MKVSQIISLLEAEVQTSANFPDLEIESACGADLMSDVMAFVKEDVVLLTGLVNTQTVRTAALLDIQLIIFVRGKKPTPDMITEAQESGIILLTTRSGLFLSCGKLYAAGLCKGSIVEDFHK